MSKPPTSTRMPLTTVDGDETTGRSASTRPPPPSRTTRYRPGASASGRSSEPSARRARTRAASSSMMLSGREARPRAPDLRDCPSHAQDRPRAPLSPGRRSPRRMRDPPVGRLRLRFAAISGSVAPGSVFGCLRFDGGHGSGTATISGFRASRARAASPRPTGSRLGFRFLLGRRFGRSSFRRSDAGAGVGSGFASAMIGSPAPAQGGDSDFRRRRLGRFDGTGLPSQASPDDATARTCGIDDEGGRALNVVATAPSFEGEPGARVPSGDAASDRAGRSREFGSRSPGPGWLICDPCGSRRDSSAAGDLGFLADQDLRGPRTGNAATALVVASGSRTTARCGGLGQQQRVRTSSRHGHQQRACPGSHSVEIAASRREAPTDRAAFRGTARSMPDQPRFLNGRFLPSR